MFNRYLTQATKLSVPLTGDRYQVNLDDLSVSDNNIVLKRQTNEHGEVCVELDWYAGRRLYPLSKVIAHTFKPTKVPTRYWDAITVEFFDGNKENLHPANLVWRFPKELGSEEHHGFCFIPMFSRYMVNREGAVFDMQRKRFMKATYSHGYYSFTLISDLGEKLGLKRHRAIGFVFLDYPTNVDVKVINHINGVRGDDKIENLEWVTHAENIKHAVETGLKDTSKPVVVENLVTGAIVVQPSVRTCARLYNLTRSNLVNALIKEPWTYDRWPHRFSFQHEEDRTDDNGTYTKVLVRNMRDKSIVEYDSVVGCSRALGINIRTLNSRLQAEYDRVYPDGLQIRRKRDVSSWYDPEDVEQAIAEAGYLTPCEIRDCLTGEVTQYSSQTKAKDDLGICEAAMHNWLNSEGKRVFKTQSDGRLVQVRRCSVLEDWWIPDDPQAAYDQVSTSKRVIVRNIQTGEEKSYDSAVECAAAHQILTTTLNYRLSMRGQKKFDRNMYQFKYANDELPFKQFSYVPPPRKRLRKTSLTDGKRLRASDTKSVPKGIDGQSNYLGKVTELKIA